MTPKEIKEMKDTINKEKEYADLAQRIQNLLYYCPPHEVEVLLESNIKETKKHVKDLKNRIMKGEKHDTETD